MIVCVTLDACASCGKDSLSPHGGHLAYHPLGEAVSGRCGKTPDDRHLGRRLTSMKRLLGLTVVVLMFLLAVPPADAVMLQFTGTLLGTNEVPPNGSTATGSAVVTLDTVAQTLRVVESFTGLIGGTASAAHIHCCVP